MTCDDVAHWLQHLLDGELDARRTRQLAAHLDDCRRCGLEADAYRDLKRALAARFTSAADTAAIERLRAFADELANGSRPADRT
jgi:anti-sigma factor RsiW